MAARRRNGLLLLSAALTVGLAVAALPVLATRARPCASPVPPRPDAPVYLVLTSDPRIEELRCEADGSLVFVTVRTPSEASTRLLDESVAGIILDCGSYGRLRAGQVGDWLTAGAGRTIVGLDLTAGQLRADAGAPVPADPSLPSPYLGDAFYGYLTFRSRPAGGVCGGGGAIPYRGASPAASLVDRLLEWAVRTCGS